MLVDPLRRRRLRLRLAKPRRSRLLTNLRRRPLLVLKREAPPSTGPPSERLFGN
jgi:hypothetical protein